MRINNIQRKQNFGMPIDKSSYLGKMKKDYDNAYKNLNLYTTPPYRKHVTEMVSALNIIDSLSPNYDIGVYPDKKARLQENQVYPPCFLLALPLNNRKTGIKIALTETKYPFLDTNDLHKIATYVKIIEKSEFN